MKRSSTPTFVLTLPLVVKSGEDSNLIKRMEAERKCGHGELANQILRLCNVIQSETLSYVAFQKNFGKSVKVRVLGMFIEQLRCKAERAGGQLIDLATPTRSLKMSQVDHLTQSDTKQPLSQCWHGSGGVQRDIYFNLVTRYVTNNAHPPSHIETETMWVAHEPALLQTGWLRPEPAKIEPYFGCAQQKSGKITVLAPSEWVVCNRTLAIAHGQEVVAETRKLVEPDGFTLRTHQL